MPYSEVFTRLKEAGLIAPELPRPIPNPLPKWYNPEEMCAYHMGVHGHSIDRCIQFKLKVQKLRDAGLLVFQPAGSKHDVHPNPLPEHKG